MKAEKGKKNCGLPGIIAVIISTIGVYSVVTYTLHTIRYGRAQKGAAAYERRLRELEALYEEE